MKAFSTISTVILLLTTLGLLFKTLAVPGKIEMDFSDEDYHLYL